MAKAVRSLVVLGDSTAVGVGDPVRGGWRGVGPLLAASFPEARYLNPSFTGARVASVRHEQLPAALRARPDAAVLLVGMNDALRSDFDAVRLHEDMDAVVGALVSAGASVVTVRFHDHSRVFRLPGPLRRALSARVSELNEVVDAVVRRHGVGCVDLDLVDGAYAVETWAVDRLHPSELGHRKLARAFARRLAEQGCEVGPPVGLECTGGIRVTPLHHAAWLVFKGVPWLWRRGRDLVPHAAAVLWRSWFGEAGRGAAADVRGHRPAEAERAS
ncbi:SGNH/GDSL hydrolase family protein [Saccharothrix australiensis]|uniref:Lysophospholipase L1-like esterase n=1 Tax=Saccharothrix australiensis TaxID=2072 RepID=A0A495VZJ7_9PSEU|nr:SGNH/GDSL hydrolase family protein [Saccharothrix australiensis]RKT53943.1 lysophospholipase L1-like esterase [Saccharothrix australiensis]